MSRVYSDVAGLAPAHRCWYGLRLFPLLNSAREFAESSAGSVVPERASGNAASVGPLRPDSGRQGRARLGVPGRRPCRPSAQPLCFSAASVASDAGKGV